ncbi:Zinc finger protein aebp2 [Dermatophagoides farinae]|uniref:Zinc finger protein aebp2 n=1 Tax=Dermatophagoides farinae TaxID=6954 RepID=A0A922KZN6_DERFA|nr:Zinc finger protein aebp2 [Dermatophagoides farinae]
MPPITAASTTTTTFDHSYHSIVVHNNNNNNEEHNQHRTARSPSNSETSSAISSCCESSDHDQCCDMNETVAALLQCDEDVRAPDSPDSGVSGSLVHSPDGKSLYEESDDYYQSIFPTPAKSPVENQDTITDTTTNTVIIPHYVSGDKCDSLLDLIQLKNNRQQTTEKIVTNDKEQMYRLIETNHQESDNDKSKHIESTTNEEQQNIPNDLKTTNTNVEDVLNQTIVLENDNDVNDDDEILQFSKEIEAVVPNIRFDGLDLALQAMYCDAEQDKTTDVDQQSTYGIAGDDERDEQTGLISNGFEFGFDFPMDQSTSNSNHCLNKSDSFADSFEMSIRTQGNATTDMQTMIKQIKMKAQSIHKNNNASIVKKQQTFCCQWHDCDWPGNYEDLAEHLREIHVELQPFLDSNGKVIKWNKRLKSSFLSAKLNKDHDESGANSMMMMDDFDGSSSQATMDDETNLDSDDEDCSNSSTEDDNQSSKISSIATRRRSRRFQSDSGCSSMMTSDNYLSSSRRSSKKNSMNGDSNHEKLEKFVCLWRGCKVFGKPSLSRNWIERHVLEQHSGPKPFKCIVDGCGQRFRAQNQLEKHVNMHFKTNPPQQQSLSSDLKQISTIKMIPPSPSSSFLLNPSSTSSSSSLIESNRPITDSCCKCQCHSFLFSNHNNCDNFDMSSLSNQDDQQQHQTSSKQIDKTNRSPSVDSVKSVANTDYLDDEFALKLSYEFRTREALMAGLKSYPPYNRYIRSSDGSMNIRSKLDKRTPTKINNAASNNKSFNDSHVGDRPQQNVQGASSSSSSSLSPTFEIYNVFKKELFDLNRRKANVPFESEVIACKTKSNGEYFYTLKWPTRHKQDIMNVENIHETKLSMSRKTSVSTAAAAAAINSGRNSYAIFKPIHYKQQSNEKLLNQRRLSKHSISRFKLKSINDEFESFPFEDSIIIDDDNADDDDDDDDDNDNDSEASEPAIDDDDDDNNDIIMELSENEDSSNDDNNNNLKSMTKKRKLSSNQYCNDQQNEDLKHEQIKRPRLASSSSSSSS